MTNHVPTPWATGAEQVDWVAAEPGEGPPMSRRARMRSQGPYSASVPPMISDLQVTVSPQIAAEAAEAANALTRFDARTAGELGGAELGPLAAVLLRTESASSSQIEQITAGAKELALASIGESDRPNARLVAANVSAMERAIALSQQITVEGIVDIQALLLGPSDPEHVGIRKEAVWIGPRASTPHTASFVAPQHERVPGLLDDLVVFTRRTDVEPMVQTALAHAQFETIHPFTDGNGRTGRALAQACLRSYGVIQQVTMPVSAGLLSAVEDYYEALTAYRAGDLDPIVAAFSSAAFHAVGNGERLVRDLLEIRARWRTSLRARSDASVWRALPVVLSQPALTVNVLAERIGISVTAAQTAIDQMVAAEVLALANANRRNRVWVAREVLDALDEFAKRAGRRRLPGQRSH